MSLLWADIHTNVTRTLISHTDNNQAVKSPVTYKQHVLVSRTHVCLRKTLIHFIKAV